MRTQRVYISRMRREETPGRIASKFCLVVGTQDIIMCVKFGDDRLRGFWSAGCQSWPFPIYLYFAGRPYNSAYATVCTVIIVTTNAGRFRRWLCTRSHHRSYI